MQIVLASSNSGKIREFREMFRILPHIDLLSLKNFPDYEADEERGESFEEIAANKAFSAAKALGYWVVADDSGLVVPSLGGSPGIYSRRFAGPEATDKENCQKLLDAMAGFQGTQRYAYFFCALALASPEKIYKVFSGKCEGEILSEERGGNGFGYDPLFVKHDFDKTFAELPDSVKVRISTHRKKAFERLAAALESASLH
jgi:XTP/dITP diphosphohydrolase